MEQILYQNVKHVQQDPTVQKEVSLLYNVQRDISAQKELNTPLIFHVHQKLIESYREDQL
jgi:hypothetical protein